MFVSQCYVHSKNMWTSFEMNSPLLSDRNTFILCSNCVSTRILNSLNFSKHFPFVFSVDIHIFLKKISIHMTKHLAPLVNMVLVGHTHPIALSLKDWLYVFPHHWKMMCYVTYLNVCFTNKWIWPRFMLPNKLWSAWTFFTFKYSNR